MALFMEFGRRGRIRRILEQNQVPMESDAFASLHFRRMVEDLGAFLVLFRGHREMSKFLRQLARFVGNRPPDDFPPPSGVLAWLPDGPCPSGATPAFNRKEKICRCMIRPSP